MDLIFLYFSNIMNSFLLLWNKFQRCLLRKCAWLSTCFTVIICHFLVCIYDFTNLRIFTGAKCVWQLFLEVSLFLHVGVHRLVELVLEVGGKLLLVEIGRLVVITFPILHFFIVLLLKHISLMIFFSFKKLYFINNK